MITIPTIAETVLPHRVFFLEVSPSGPLVVGSPDGSFSWLAPDLSPLGRFELGPRPTDVAIAPAGDLLAVGVRGKLSLLNAADGRERYSVPVGEHPASRFSEDGQRLWTIHTDGDRAMVAVRAVADGRILREEAFGIPVRGSSCSLHPHPGPGAVSIWVAAGQDGQWIFWAQDGGQRIAIQQLEGVSDCTPPVFAPEGGSFLLCELYVVSRWSLQGGTRTATIANCPWLEGDDNLGESVAWAGPDRALIQTEEGCLYVVELESGRLVDEACIVGHAPRPVGEIWPNHAREAGRTSDLSHFRVGPSGRAYSVHRRDLKALGDLDAVGLASWNPVLVK